MDYMCHNVAIPPRFQQPPDSTRWDETYANISKPLARPCLNWHPYQEKAEVGWRVCPSAKRRLLLGAQQEATSRQWSTCPDIIKDTVFKHLARTPATQLCNIILRVLHICEILSIRTVSHLTIMWPFGLWSLAVAVLSRAKVWVKMKAKGRGTTHKTLKSKPTVYQGKL